MDLIRFFDSHGDDIELRTINEETNSSFDSIPNDTVGFTYYHNNEDSVSYVIGTKLKSLKVVKIVNEELYEKFIEFGRLNEGAKYIVGVINRQVYFLCLPANTNLIESNKQLQECLYYEMDIKDKTK